MEWPEEKATPSGKDPTNSAVRRRGLKEHGSAERTRPKAPPSRKAVPPKRIRPIAYEGRGLRGKSALAEKSVAGRGGALEKASPTGKNFTNSALGCGLTRLQTAS